MAPDNEDFGLSDGVQDTSDGDHDFSDEDNGAHDHSDTDLTPASAHAHSSPSPPANEDAPTRPTLLITSHDRLSPLCPAPLLEYDLRTTPNPDKKRRLLWTGLDRKVQKELGKEEVFQKTLSRTGKEIRVLMRAVGGAEGGKHEERDGAPDGVPEADGDAAADGDDVNWDLVRRVLKANRTLLGNRMEDAEVGVTGEEEAMRQLRVMREGGKPPLLRVGCFCGSGHHRSVAFAEALAKERWPEGWNVKVVHRDLTEQVKRMKAKKRKEIRERLEERKRRLESTMMREKNSSADV